MPKKRRIHQARSLGNVTARVSGHESAENFQTLVEDRRGGDEDEPRHGFLPLVEKQARNVNAFHSGPAIKRDESNTWQSIVKLVVSRIRFPLLLSSSSLNFKSVLPHSGCSTLAASLINYNTGGRAVAKSFQIGGIFKMLQSVKGNTEGDEIIQHDLLATEEVGQNARPQKDRRTGRWRRGRRPQRRRSHDVVIEPGPKDARGATGLRLQSAAGQPGGSGRAAQLQYFRQLEECPAGCNL